VVTARPDPSSDDSHYPTRAERRADVWVHGVGLPAAAASALVLAALSARNQSLSQLIAVLIYGAGLFLMLLSSTLYNLERSAARRRQLRRLDHAAIFLLIACTYTPFTTQRFPDDWAIGMTVAVWSIAALGMVVKLIVHDPPKYLSLAAYLGCGWLALIAIKPFMTHVAGSALLLLLIGGIVYSAGAAIYAAQNLKYRRAIWHGFVIIAASLHWTAVLLGVVWST
jgi:hemolysin III